MLLDEDRSREQDVPAGSDAVWAGREREKHTGVKLHNVKYSHFCLRGN